MKKTLISILAFAPLCLAGVSTAAETGSQDQYRAQLASSDQKARVAALQELGKLGRSAKAEAADVERCIGDESFDVRFAAVRALPQILGPEAAVKVFDKVVRDGKSGSSKGAALIGLETCGSNALPTLRWSIKSGDANVRYQALVTAAIVDEEGTLYSDVLPLLTGQSEQVSYCARKYVLAYGTRQFFREHSRWPTDFLEIEAEIRKLNPLITLAQITKDAQIRFEPQEDGGLKVRAYRSQPDGTFKAGTFYILTRPLKR